MDLEVSLSCLSKDAIGPFYSLFEAAARVYTPSKIQFNIILPSRGVIGILHWHNPSGRTMALGSTQPLTEMSTRDISSGG
jgi:hypothetical protein